MCASLFPHPLHYYWYKVGMLKVSEAYVCMYVCMVTYIARVWINRGKVANPARGQLSREKSSLHKIATGKDIYDCV